MAIVVLAVNLKKLIEYDVDITFCITVEYVFYIHIYIRVRKLLYIPS